MLLRCKEDGLTYLQQLRRYRLLRVLRVLLLLDISRNDIYRCDERVGMELGTCE